MTIRNQTGFQLPAVARAIGPFATSQFLEVVSAFDAGTPLSVSAGDAFIPLRRVEDEIYFAGDADVTDYHTPHGSGCEDLIGAVAEEESPTRFVLDSLPAEAADPLAAGLTAVGWSIQTRVHEVAAVLDLPDSFEEYMAEIGKKERHEMRRKRRRYEASLGKLHHETHRGRGWAFDEFVRLHRRAAGEKGSFLTDERLDMFGRLADIDGWRLDALRTPDGSAAAVVFGYSDDTGYYLYNSAYDPDMADVSPGVVLLGSMIEQAITEEMPRFDFLKGDETYKFRLGAQRRPLTEITATPVDGR